MQLRFLPEIDTVCPLIVRPLEPAKAGDDPDKDFDVQLVGYSASIGLGGPPAIVEGKTSAPSPSLPSYPQGSRQGRGAVQAAGGQRTQRVLLHR